MSSTQGQLPLLPQSTYSATAHERPLLHIPRQDSDTVSSLPAKAGRADTNSSDEDENAHRRSPKFAPIRGAPEYEEYNLEKTASQIHGGLSNDERTELRQIASLHRSKSAATQPGLERNDTLAGVSEDDPRLDPDRAEFDIYIWARAFMRAQDEIGIKATNPGFTFKDLSVSGSGSTVNLQANVASVLMAPFRLNEYISIGKKTHKRILRDFSGIVRSGEMLVVLGRPGSGCSTFLKTICGELSGLEMEPGSVVHYDGEPVIPVSS